MCTHAYQHTNIHIYINTYCVVSECVKETDLYVVVVFVVAVIDDEKVARKARFPQFKYNNNNSTNLRTLVVFVGVVITSLFL